MIWNIYIHVLSHFVQLPTTQSGNNWMENLSGRPTANNLALRPRTIAAICSKTIHTEVSVVLPLLESTELVTVCTYTMFRLCGQQPQWQSQKQQLHWPFMVPAAHTSAPCLFRLASTLHQNGHGQGHGNGCGGGGNGDGGGNAGGEGGGVGGRAECMFHTAMANMLKYVYFKTKLTTALKELRERSRSSVH